MTARGKFPAQPPTTFTDWHHEARLARRSQLQSPGAWRQVPGTYTRAVAAHIRSGRIAAFRPAGSFEAKYAPTDAPGRVILYIRPAQLGPES
jgi:hypothetical protein